MPAHKKGDLVHIPQAVTLIDCDEPYDEAQLTIPLRMEQTASPTIGVVTRVSEDTGYVKVYCDGSLWSVKDDSIYAACRRENR